MAKRDVCSAPVAGERVAYVMIKGSKGMRCSDLAEDPVYVLQNDLPINFQHYIDNQLKLPLCRIFEPILGEAAEKVLFDGEHTRTVHQPKVALAVGKADNLSGYAVVRDSCLSCKRILTYEDNGDQVCLTCKPKKQEIYIERRMELLKAEKIYGDMWVQCQRCQSSLHSDILCSSRDCPIFYRRIKAKKSIEELQYTLDKLSDDKFVVNNSPRTRESSSDK